MPQAEPLRAVKPVESILLSEKFFKLHPFEVPSEPLTPNEAIYTRRFVSMQCAAQTVCLEKRGIARGTRTGEEWDYNECNRWYRSKDWKNFARPFA